MNQSIELFEFVSEDTIDASDAVKDAVNEKNLVAVNFLQSVFTWLASFFSKSYQPINEQTIRLIPLMCRTDKVNFVNTE